MGVIPDNLMHDPATFVAVAWNERAAKALDQITPTQPFPLVWILSHSMIYRGALGNEMGKEMSKHCWWSRQHELDRK